MFQRTLALATALLSITLSQANAALETEIVSDKTTAMASTSTTSGAGALPTNSFGFGAGDLLAQILAEIQNIKAQVITQTGAINSLTAGYSPSVADLLFQEGPSRAQNQPLDAQLIDIAKTIANFPKTQTMTIIQNILNFDSQTRVNLSKSYPGADNYWILAALNGTAAPTEIPQDANAALSAGSLLDARTYAPNGNERDRAEAFIRYVTMIGTVPELPDFLKNRTQTENDIKTAKSKNGDVHLFENADIANYFYALRSHAAVQSLAVNNLYHMLERRTPKSTLDNKSALQVDIERAESRLKGSEWYDQMKSASPAAVERESAYINAEILHQLVLLNQEIERINATLTVMQVQFAQFNHNSKSTKLVEEAQTSYNILVGKPEGNEIKAPKPNL